MGISIYHVAIIAGISAAIVGIDYAYPRFIPGLFPVPEGQPELTKEITVRLIGSKYHVEGTVRNLRDVPAPNVVLEVVFWDKEGRSTGYTFKQELGTIEAFEEQKVSFDINYVPYNARDSSTALHY